MTFAGFERQDARTIWNFFRMLLRDRFMGSRLGAAWSVANPLLLLSIYTFVFAFIFKSRLPGSEPGLSYTIWLISGLGPWLAVAESLTSAANSIHGNAGIVKNLAIKAECLPIAAAMSGLIPLAVSFSFLVVLLIADGWAPSWHVLAIVPAGLALFGFVTGLGIALSALVTFFRDLGVALPSVLIIILFSTPILYPVTAVPRALQMLAELNPFYIAGQWIRVPLLDHALPPVWGLVWISVLAGATFWGSLLAFRRVKGYLPSAV